MREGSSREEYLAVASTVIVNAVFPGLYDITLGAHQLNIEHAAQHSGIVIAMTGDKSLEPHCLAKVVCGVVEVQIHALLRQGTPHQQRTQSGAVCGSLCLCR